MYHVKKKAHFYFFQITFCLSSQDLSILSFQGYMMMETLLILTIESQHNHLFVRLMFSSYFMQSAGLGYFLFFLLMDSTIINNFKTRSPFFLFSCLPYTEKKSDKSSSFCREGQGKSLSNAHRRKKI